MRITAITVVFGFLVIWGPNPARAQDAGQQQAESDQTQVDVKMLKKLYEDAKQLYKEGKYREARILFVKVKEMAKSAGLYSVMIDYRIGLCYEGEGDYENAIKHYRIYVDAAKIPKRGPTRAQVMERIRRLRRELEASPLPHAPAETPSPEPEAQGSDEYVDLDVPPPPGARPSPRRRARRPVPPPAGRPAPPPKEPAGQPEGGAAGWWMNYGVYVLVAVVATGLVVGFAISASKAAGMAGPVPADGPAPSPAPSQGITVLSW